MNKPGPVYWIVSVAALVWGAFGVFDFYMTSTGNEEYLKDFPTDMIAWIQGFPLWRKIMWALSVGLSALGGVLLVLRIGLASRALWTGAVLMIAGFVFHDLLMADGLKYYGAAGTIASIIIVLVSFGFAMYATHSKNKGYI